MQSKLLVLTLLVVGMAAFLLVLRQQRMELAHASAMATGRIQEIRRQIWDAQADAALQMRPMELQRRVALAQLTLVPSLPTQSPSDLAAAPGRY